MGCVNTTPSDPEGTGYEYTEGSHRTPLYAKRGLCIYDATPYAREEGEKQ